MSQNKDLCTLDDLTRYVRKCNRVREVLESTASSAAKVARLQKIGLAVENSVQLSHELEKSKISAEGVTQLEYQEEEEAEIAEKNVQQMSAVELLTIVSSKGLSADHVFIIGCDDVNLKWVTKNAFYVAITRARKSLHIITSLKSGGSSACHHFIDHFPDKHVHYGWYNKKDRTTKDLAARSEFINRLAWFQRNVLHKQPAGKKPI